MWILTEGDKAEDVVLGIRSACRTTVKDNLDGRDDLDVRGLVSARKLDLVDRDDLDGQRAFYFRLNMTYLDWPL
ncbi:hypothetical protein ACLOJK_013800 [Asimina triloba]